jgi:hypothetical protein
MKNLIVTILCLSLLLVFLSGCGPKPEEVALQLAEAVNAGDREAALALFAEDAVVTSVNPEPFSGKEEIQGWLEGMIMDNFQLHEEVEKVEGNTVYLDDTMSMDSMAFYDIDTMTGQSVVDIENGKIQAINFSWSDETLADLQAAPFVSKDDLIGIWTVGTYIKFNDDNTLRVALKTADLNAPPSEEQPGSVQNWTYDGMVITFQGVAGAGEGFDTCTPEQVGVYFVKWAGSDLDRLKFEPIVDECGERYGGMQWGNWSRVEL